MVAFPVVFMFKYKRLSISDFVYESLLLSPLYVKLPVTDKSPFVIVFPVDKLPSMVVPFYIVILLVVDNIM